MTSTERRRLQKYQRRKAKREEHKQALYAQYDCYDEIISAQALYLANKKSRKNVCWKASVQRYQMNLLRNLLATKKSLEAGKYKSKGFVEFVAQERGKERHIRSVHFSERVVQRSLCDNALVPMLSKGLIYDNGACIKGKGVDRSLNRLDTHLAQFYRQNGCTNEGYVLQFDFSGYFDSILHDICYKMYENVFNDKRILELLHGFVHPFGFPFMRSNWHREKPNFSEAENSGMSLGLGSQVSQITAVSYADALDHFIKQTLHARFYGRYTDDGYLLFRTKSEAKTAYKMIQKFCEPYGIRVNERKTHIVKLSHGFTYLKVKHRLTKTGKVLRCLSRDCVTKQRRKMKKLLKLREQGRIQMEDIEKAYSSWKGHALQRWAYKTVANMDELYRSLYNCDPPKCKLEKKWRYPEWKTENRESPARK